MDDPILIESGAGAAETPSVEGTSSIDAATGPTEDAISRWERSGLIENLAHGCWIVDSQGTICAMNTTGERLLSCSASDLIGKSHDLVVQSSFQETGDECPICKNLRCGETDWARLTFSVKPGLELAMECLGTPVLDNGQMAGAAVLFRPASPRAPMGAKEKAVRDLYKSFFENGIEGMFRVAPDGRLLEINTAFARLYGYASANGMVSKLNGSEERLYVDPDWQQEFIRMMNEHGTVRDFQTRMYRQDGEVIWISRNARTLYDEKGRPILYEGTVADITHRKRTEDALRESQRFIEGLANASPAILYVYDLNAERYLYVNYQVTKVLGYSVEEVIDMGPEFNGTAVHPDDRELATERKRQLAEGKEGQNFVCEYRMFTKDSRPLYLQWRDTVFTRSPDGQPEQILGMALDITERRQARDEVERSREQLRALSVRLQQVREEERVGIAREVHDELGQSLTAISIDLGWVRSRCGKMLDPSVGQLLEKIDQMSGLIGHLITAVQKVATHLRPPVLDEFGLVAAIEWQAREFEKRSGIRCQLSMGWRSKITQQDASTAIFRIFQEVLTNVVRHAGATKVYVRMRENAGTLFLVIKDNGRGITEGEKSESLGILGMRERASVFSGTVEIHGAPGAGTTVSVEFPVAEVRRVKAPPRITSLQPALASDHSLRGENGKRK